MNLNINNENDILQTQKLFALCHLCFSVLKFKIKTYFSAFIMCFIIPSFGLIIFCCSSYDLQCIQLHFPAGASEMLPSAPLTRKSQVQRPLLSSESMSVPTGKTGRHSFEISFNPW